MDSKPLLYGLIGFFLGGFIVAVAATTFDKPSDNKTSMSMDQSAAALQGKTGDDYDEAFIAEMIAHHQSAVDMARLSADNAKHDEIKRLSKDIIAAQEKEIGQMKQWQKDWDYKTDAAGHGQTGH